MHRSPKSFGAAAPILKVWPVQHGQPSSPLWGGDGGGGVSASLSKRSAGTPTLALPTRGRERAPHPDSDPGSSLRAVRDDTLLVITGLVPVIPPPCSLPSSWTHLGRLAQEALGSPLPPCGGELERGVLAPDLQRLALTPPPLPLPAASRVFPTCDCQKPISATAESGGEGDTDSSG